MRRPLLLSFFLLINFFFSNAQQWTDFTMANTSSELADDYVTCSAIDKNGNIWVGTKNGLSHFNGTTWKNYTTQEGLCYNLIQSMAIDSKGNIWTGTVGRLCRFDGKNSKIYYTGGMTDVNAITIDKDDNVWVCLPDQGIYKFQDSSFLYQSFSAKTTYDVLEFDIKGNLWFGNDKGVYRYNGKNAVSIRTFNTNAIKSDSKGNVWIGGSEGVIKYSHDSIIYSYSIYNSAIGKNYVSHIAID